MNGEEPPVSRVLPAIQIVGLSAVVGVAIADLIIADAEVPWIVYGLIGSIVIGIAPENLWNLVRK